MKSFEFEWRDENGICKRMFVSKFHSVDCWLSALDKCGWENRLTLKTINDKGYTIQNWWDVSGYLPLLSAPQNEKADYLFAKENWPFN